MEAGTQRAHVVNVSRHVVGDKLLATHCVFKKFNQFYFKKEETLDGDIYHYTENTQVVSLTALLKYCIRYSSYLSNPSVSESKGTM